MTTKFPQLCLGTAQLGMPYGINNTLGQPSAKEACRLLQTAIKSGVLAFDTSPEYGHSEKILGQNLSKTSQLIFISKVPHLDWKKNQAEILKKVESALMKTRQDLRIKKIPVYLLHRFADLINQNQVVLKFLLQQKRKGLIGKIGISVYTPREAAISLTIKEIQVIQIPLNLVDKRFLKSGFIKKAADRKITLLARSIFLQGLFFKKKIPKHLSAFRPYQKIIRHLSSKHHLGLNELALRYILGLKGLSYVLIGAESSEQLAENVKAAQKGALDKKIMAEINQIGSAPKSIVNPSLWTVNPQK